jgi:hypothetical protein
VHAPARDRPLLRLGAVEVATPEGGGENVGAVVRGRVPDHALGEELLGHGYGVDGGSELLGRQNVLQNVV